MSDKKIVVPHGMIEAYSKVVMENFGEVSSESDIAVEAALRWLSENPIVPTVSEIASLEINLFGWAHPLFKSPIERSRCRDLIDIWQQLMCCEEYHIQRERAMIALGKDNSDRFIEAISGYTFSDAEAAKIIDYISSSTNHSPAPWNRGL